MGEVVVDKLTPLHHIVGVQVVREVDIWNNVAEKEVDQCNDVTVFLTWTQVWLTATSFQIWRPLDSKLRLRILEARFSGMETQKSPTVAQPGCCKTRCSCGKGSLGHRGLALGTFH